MAKKTPPKSNKTKLPASTRSSSAKKKSTPSTEIQLCDLLRCIDTASKSASAQWFLFGAQALAIYGIPRFTADVDVTVRIDSQRVKQLVAELKKQGVALRIAADEVNDFIAASRVLPFVHLKTQLPIDCVLSGPGFEDQLFSRVVS
jgi:hypothetical protein